ncbi:MAG: DUF6036 family nucleotidyltransferase [Vicinamibacterales bacterium]
MRALTDAEHLQRFMHGLGAASAAEARVYFTGGSTAVLLGWRLSTIDVDIRIVPEHDALFRAIPRLKEQLGINIELASPDQFIPVRPGWEDRSPFIARHERISFHHFDLTAQALAKIERGHAQDRGDVSEMLRRTLVSRAGLLDTFEAIEPLLYKYPAIDPASFREAVLEAAR